MIIDDNCELVRILECTHVHKYEIVDLPGDSSWEHTGVKMAPTLDAKRTSVLAPCEGSSLKGYYIHCNVVLDYKSGSTKLEARGRAGS